MLDLLFFLLIFVPGVIVAGFIFKALGYKPRLFEVVLAGFILWSFLLSAPSLLIGLFSSFVTVYFSIFTLFSALILFISLAWITFCLKKKGFKIKLSLKIKQNDFFVFIIILCLLIFIIFLTLNQPLYLSFDTVAVYLPLSKSIVSTGGLQFEYYHLSHLLATHSPILPIVYAWVISEIGSESIFFLPCLFFSMLIISLYLLTKELTTNNNVSFVSVIAFIVVPAVISTLAYHSLYLEIGFTCFFISSIYLFIKAIKSDNIFYYTLASASIFLFMLSRFELGLFVIPSFFAIFIFLKLNFPVKRAISTLLLVSPFWSLLLFNIIISNHGFDLQSFLIYGVLPLITIFSILTFFLFSRINTFDLNKGPPFRKIILMILPLLPVFFYILRNFNLNCINLNFIWDSVYHEGLSFYSEIVGVKTEVPLIFDVFRWDRLVLSEAGFAIFLVPITVGLVYIAYGLLKRKLNNYQILILLIFLSYFITWSWLLRCDDIVRRLFVFAPFGAIVIAYGFDRITRLFNSERFLITIFTFFSTVIFVILWLFRVNAYTLNDFIYSHRTFGTISVYDLAFYSLLLFSILSIFCSTLKKYFTHKILPLIVKLLCLFLVLSVILPPLSTISIFEDNRFNCPTHISDVVDYYNNYIDDSYTSVVFFMHELIWYANRSVIDLSEFIYSLPLISILKEENRTLIKNSLFESDIRYFLLPKNGSDRYDTYLKFYNSTELFKMINNDWNFKQIAEFRHYTLFKLFSQKELIEKSLFFTDFKNTSGIIPLNTESILVQSESGISISGENTTRSRIIADGRIIFWKQSGGLINLHDTTIDDHHCLEINIMPHSKTNIFLYHNYNESLNLETEQNIAFWFFGSNTNVSIPFVFQTNSWSDCFSFNLIDNFVGWRYCSIPKYDIKVYQGSPSWNNISRLEVLFSNFYGSEEYTFFLSDIVGAGFNIGLFFNLPILNVEGDVVLLLDLDLRNQTSWKIEIKSQSEDLLYSSLLADGVNTFILDSKFLKYQNNKLSIVGSTISGEPIELRYLTIQRLR